MEDKYATSLKCFIHKFRNKFNLSKDIKVYPCLRHRVIAVHYQDGKIEFVKIGSKSQPAINELKGIKRFLWVNRRAHQASISCQREVQFTALSENGILSTGVFAGGVVQDIFSQSVSDIFDHERKDLVGSDIKLLASEGEYVVLVANDYLISLIRKEGKFHKVFTISTPHNGSCCGTVQVTDDVIITLEANNIKLNFFEIATGKLLVVVDLQRINVEPDRLLFWKVSHDLKTLSIVENTQALTVINLQAYVQKNPSCMKRMKEMNTSTTFRESSTCQTCHIGDSVWQEKLLSLHEKHMVKKPLPWFQTNYQQDDQKKKRKWFVSGFKKRNSAVDQSCSARTSVYCKAYLPAFVQSMTLTDCVVEQSVTSVAFMSEKESVLCICDHTNSHVMTERLASSQILLSADPSYPHMVVTDTHLTCIVVNNDIQQEDFVSKMMVYAGASVADTLCHINKWGRCSIPLHTLDISLKQRQLDTVMFFLKSKENFFSASKSTSVFTPSSPQSSSPSWTVTASHLDNLNQLEPALNLFVSTIKENMVDQEAIFFSQKLADILLDFLYEALKDGLTLSDNLKDLGSHVTEVEDLGQAVEKLLDLIADVRNCIRKLTEKRKSGKDPGVTTQRVPAAGMPVKEWAKLSGNDLIESGVIKNEIPLLQTYLCEQNKPGQAQISTVLQSSLNRAFYYLAKHQCEPAVILLANLGFEVDKKLWEMALKSVDSDTRDYIVQQLQERSALQPEHADIVLYSKQLTALYPCASFTAATEKQACHRETTNSCDVLKQFVSRKYDLIEECGEIGETSKSPSTTYQSSDSTALRYSHVMLDWLQWWDTDTRQLVLMDAHISKIDPSDMEYRQELIVDYLLRYNKVDTLLTWLDKVDNVDHSLLQDIHQYLSKTTSHNQIRILEHCARCGLFLDISNFPFLLDQMSLAGGPLQLPHPLCKYPADVVDQFHKDFVQYCVDSDVPSVLWQYCFLHKVPADTLYLVLHSLEDSKWLKMFVPMYCLANNPHDKLCLYEASLANAAILWSLEQPVLASILKQGETIPLLASLMYSPHKLVQVEQGIETLQAFGGASVEEVERALIPYPKLHSAIFPASTIDKPKNDVTVYHLLKDNAPFDPTRLFGWQTMNKLACEEAPKQMPHFSQSELVNKYGYTARLQYTYYLKQGRPGFAFITFIAEEMEVDSTSFSTKGLAYAAGTALWIGMKNFHNPQISCACVVFTEMLGQSSLLLRTYLQVGQEILVHLNKELTGNLDKRKQQARKNEEEIASRLCTCASSSNRKHAQSVLKQLEDAISASLKREEVPSVSFEAGQRWTIAVLFCRSLQIPLTTRFLEQCAAADKWLTFLWFAQMHQFSKEQLHNILYHFRKPNLRQHLHYVIENAESKAINKEDKGKSSSEGQAGVKGKDVRSSLYSRIGLTKEKDAVESSSSEEDPHPVVPPVNSQDASDEALLVDYASAPDDLFQIVFAAQSSRCPWKSFLTHSVVLRNPILAELAACSQNASFLCCLCGWLVAMMDVDEHRKYIENHGKVASHWNMKHLMGIIDIFLQKKWHSTLATGFDIFQPDSPVVYFLKFSAKFSEYKDYQLCNKLLEDYKEALHNYCHEMEDVKKSTIIGDSDWMQQFTYKILHHHFVSTTSLYEILQMLKILDSQSMVLVFKFEVPEFGRLARLLQMVVDCSLQGITFSNLISSNKEQYDAECVKIVEMMIEKKSFRKGRDFSKEVGLCQDRITMAETMDKKEALVNSPLWQSPVMRQKFWRQLAESFVKYKLAVDKATKFFLGEAEEVESYAEKTLLYNLCVQHIESNPHSEYDVEEHDKIYHTMCLYRIRAKLEQMQRDAEKDDFMKDIFVNQEEDKIDVDERKKEFLNFGKMPQKGQTSKELTQQEVGAYDQLIGELLDSGQIIECDRLVTEFSHYSQDLVIILTCIRLAIGSVSIRENMDMSMVALMAGGSQTSHRRLSLAVTPSRGSFMNKSASISSLASIASTTWDFLPPEREKTVITMETLLENCHHGTQCCKQIINCYIIASILDMGYEDVVLSKEFIILKQLLKTDLLQRFKLASEFLGSSSLTNSQVAGFLCDSVVEAYRYMFTDEEERQQRDLLFDPSEDKDVAGLYVTLCSDHSLMGDKLMDVVASLSREGEDLKTVLPMQTELLILSHLCHTKSCNMEGISNTLRMARAVTARLASAQNFSLMVRLLIGVGRFNEMTYIFDSLKKNDQFELLLKKGIEKENSLKIALLDYLKRYHPLDVETYDMVAHNFVMHREIAKMLEAKAQRDLAKFKDKQLDNTLEIQNNLQTIAQYFTDAAGSYFKDNCVRHAQNCIRQARLVALQIHCLPSGLCVIHLTPEGATHLIASHSKFSEALIISETYGRKDCWAEALCSHVIQNGDFRYLQEFKSRIRLTTTLISDTVQRYQAIPNKSSQSMNNMKKFLDSYCKDIKLKYKLALEFGFKDMLTTLEKGDSKSYIQDIMATLS